MKQAWVGGNEVVLLENGEAFFPRVFERIRGARRQVLIETFILFDDKVGRQLQSVLIETARRGVQIELTIDGYGSADLDEKFLGAMTRAGVRVHVFDARPKIFGYRRNLFRRMHRKIVVIDAEIAFVGGINYSADHLADFGPMAKQDYSVEVRGPIVSTLHAFAESVLSVEPRRSLRSVVRSWASYRERRSAPRNDAAGARAMFVTRDNERHRNDIERQYRIAFRAARRHVYIANAYFFPGFRFLRDMRRAARRGVTIHLILQGQPDMAIVRVAARMLYEHLLRAGIQIHEYCERPLHGKVAQVDDEWSTVGSSNLDPLSLSLNLEANLMIMDRPFAVTLRERLDYLIQHQCKRMEPGVARNSGLWRFVPTFVVFHVLRRFPSWATWLPAHRPRLDSIAPLAETADGHSADSRGEHHAVP